MSVDGQLDIDDSELAREVRRSVKRGQASLSLGFLVKSAHDEGDVKVLDEIDEISIVAAPANEDTRILSTKALDDEYARVRDEGRRWMYELLTMPTESKSLDRPRKRERGPIEIKSYPVD